MSASRNICAFLLIVTSFGSNAQGLSALYDSNDVLIGEYVGETGGNPIVHNTRGFRFAVIGRQGMVAGVIHDVGGTYYPNNYLLYQSSDCTGQPFFEIDSTVPSGGMVLGSSTIGIFYVEKLPTYSQFNPTSRRSTGGSPCELNPSTSMILLVPAIPNDPSVTGVPNGAYAPPLRLEIVPLSAFFEIFKNGFESTQVPQLVARGAAVVALTTSCASTEFCGLAVA